MRVQFQRLLFTILLSCALLFLTRHSPLQPTVGECTDSYTSSWLIDPCTLGASMVGDGESGLYIPCQGGGLFKFRDGVTSQINITSICASPTHVFQDETGVYVACGETGGVIAIDPDDNTFHTIFTPDECPQATGVYRSNTTGTVFAVSFERGVMARYTNGTMAQMAQCQVALRVIGNEAKHPHTIFADCNRSAIAIDTITGAITDFATTSICTSIEDLALDELLYAACNTGLISITPTANSSVANITIIASQEQCLGAKSVSYDSTNRIVVAACYAGSSIAITNSNRVIPLISSKQLTQPRTIHVDRHGMIWAIGSTDKLVRVSGTTADIFSDHVQLAATGVARHPTSGKVYLKSSTNVVRVFDGPVLFPLTLDPHLCSGGSVITYEHHTGLIYVFCQMAIGIVNDTQVIGYITGLSNPTSIYRPPNSTVLYISDYQLGILSFDGSALTTVIPPSQCGAAQAVHYDEVTGETFAACRQNGIIVLRGATVVSLLPMAACQTARGLYHHAATGSTYAGCRNGVFRIDGHQVQQLVDVDQCASARSLQRDHRTGAIIAVCGNSVLAIYESGIIRHLMVNEQCFQGYIFDAFYASDTGVVYGVCSTNDVVVVSHSFRCYGGTYWLKGECRACPVNTFLSDHSLESFGACQACPPGKIAPLSGYADCWSCPSGSFAQFSGSVVCSLCRPGEYQPHDGATGCMQAQPGYYTDSAGANLVTPCQPGTATPKNGTISCAPCLPGQYQPESGQTHCLPCPLGQYAVSPGSSQCEVCEPGFYSSIEGSPSCSPCVPGSASNVTGLTQSCPGCEPGYYQGGIGKTSCIDCEPYTYAEKSHSTSCTRCEAQVNPERTACNSTICPSNSHYTRDGKCELCSLGMYSAAGGICTTCSMNTYTPFQGSDCISCQLPGMNGIICSGGLASVEEGYWAYQSEVDVTNVLSSSAKTSMLLYQAVPCPAGFCPGTQLQLSNSNHSVITNSSDSSIIQYCHYPRLNSKENHMCGQCVDGYIPWGSDCVECRGTNGPLVFGGIVLSFILVIFLFLSSLSTSVGTVAVLLFFIQTAQVEIGPVSGWFRWMQISNLSLQSSASCIAPLSPYEQMLFSIMIPFLLIGELLVVSIVHYVIYRWFQNHPSPPPVESGVLPIAAPANSEMNVYGQNDDTVDVINRDVDFSSSQGAPSVETFYSTYIFRLRHKLEYLFSEWSLDQYLGAIGSILVFCYTQVASTSISYLYCIDVGNDVSLVFNAPTMDCNSDRYRTFLVPVILSIITYVAGFPIAIFVRLWFQRRSIANKETAFGSFLGSDNLSPPPSPLPSSRLSDDRLITNDIIFVTRWGPLYRMFLPHASFYFKSLILLRRASFVLASIFYVQQPAIKFMTFTILNFGSLLIHLLVLPFGSKIINNLETASYIILVLVSIILTGHLPPYPITVHLTLFLLIIPFTVGLIVYIIHQQYVDVRAKFFSSSIAKTTQSRATTGTILLTRAYSQEATRISSSSNRLEPLLTSEEQKQANLDQHDREQIEF